MKRKKIDSENLIYKFKRIMEKNQFSFFFALLDNLANEKNKADRVKRKHSSSKTYKKISFIFEEKKKQITLTDVSYRYLYEEFKGLKLIGKIIYCSLCLDDNKINNEFISKILAKFHNLYTCSDIYNYYIEQNNVKKIYNISLLKFSLMRKNIEVFSTLLNYHDHSSFCNELYNDKVKLLMDNKADQPVLTMDAFIWKESVIDLKDKIYIKAISFKEEQKVNIDYSLTELEKHIHNNSVYGGLVKKLTTEIPIMSIHQKKKFIFLLNEMKKDIYLSGILASSVELTIENLLESLEVIEIDLKDLLLHQEFYCKPIRTDEEEYSLFYKQILENTTVILKEEVLINQIRIELSKLYFPLPNDIKEKLEEILSWCERAIYILQRREYSYKEFIQAYNANFPKDHSYLPDEHHEYRFIKLLVSSVLPYINNKLDDILPFSSSENASENSFKNKLNKLSFVVAQT